MPLEQAFGFLGSYAATDIIFPFILFFSIIYAGLKTAKVLDEGNVPTVIALALSGTIIGLHINGQMGAYDPINVLKQAGWQVAVILLSFIFLMIFVITISPKTAERITSGAWGGALVIVAIVLVGLIISTSVGLLPEDNVISYIFDSELWSFVIAIAVFFGLLWWIGRE